MNWRDHLPDGCPPDDALPAHGLVYRLVNKINFDSKDFLSRREEKPDGEWDVSECVAGGVSIYTELHGIKRLQEMVPAMRRKKITKGILDAKHGKMKNTPSQTHSSHYTWWIPTDSQPWKVFQLVNLSDT